MRKKLLMLQLALALSIGVGGLSLATIKPIDIYASVDDEDDIDDDDDDFIDDGDIEEDDYPYLSGAKAPKCTSIENGGIYAKRVSGLTIRNNGSRIMNVQVSWNNGNSVKTFKENDLSYENFKLTEESDYILEITYKTKANGDIKTVSYGFTIDNTAPTISGASDGKTYNSTVTIKATDDNLKTVRVNKKVISGKVYCISAAGTYIVDATDKAGNVSSIEFKLTLPSIRIAGVTKNKIYDSAREITIISNLKLKSVKLDNKELGTDKSLTVSKDGVHTLQVTDTTGAKVSTKFTIDTTAPVFYKTNGKTKITGGKVNNSKYTLVVKDTTAGISYVKVDGSKVNVSNGKVTVTGKGKHIIIAVDKAGNSTSIKLALKK